MKKVVIYLIFLAIVSEQTLFAQQLKVQNLPKFDNRWVHFGFCLGLNKYDFAIKPVENYLTLFDSLYVVESTPEWGFNVGIVSDLRLGNYWNMRFIPILTFSSRIMEYKLMVKQKEKVTRFRKIESTIIDFPILFKYKSARLNNFRAYIIGGPKFMLDLASLEKKKEDTEEDLVKIKRHDYGFEIGVGFDFYLTYFKFAPEIKFSMGLNDMIVREGDLFTNSIQRLNSKAIIISFLFE